MTVDDVRGLAARIEAEVGKAVVGQGTAVRRLLIALFASGHVLLEGPPGVAKTLLAQCFAAATGLAYGRVQFTPDLMPGDIIGANLFNFQTSAFTLTRGPIFTELLLADEINRTPPKTQAALLEAMQERQVTIDGTTYPLGARFMVVATQNPIENQGVYPLPEAQLDRFLFKYVLGYPDAADERAIVLAHGNRFGVATPAGWQVVAQADAALLGEAVATVEAVRLVDEVIDYIVALVRATRTTVDLSSGASPRAAVMLAGAARAAAALDGRDYVLPDDVKALAPDVLRHRVVVSPAAEIDGVPVDRVIASLIEATAAPR
ncbi:AAA family ATPase [Glacieibacterium megasporae]|uniref:AAA family ATPase n=1 Tax=Glacieibacterium megasporae TaxID=2835787 RepID=UPI001C1E0C32|nr:MoxR family ATPase [Polymorphobacter megasporae]UAJ09760.1 MoxR family ATPase [Polymorphobacter megasporae]